MYLRICKEEVVTDFEREVKRIKEVKLYSSRQPGILQQMETFLMVNSPTHTLNFSKPCVLWILFFVFSVPFLCFVFFSQRADAKLADVESSLQELNVLSSAVAEYFCEDPATFKLDECCSIFHSFCKRFDTAVQVKSLEYEFQHTVSSCPPCH